jgi:hypothetical protein
LSSKTQVLLLASVARQIEYKESFKEEEFFIYKIISVISLIVKLKKLRNIYF